MTAQARREAPRASSAPGLRCGCVAADARRMQMRHARWRLTSLLVAVAVAACTVPADAVARGLAPAPPKAKRAIDLSRNCVRHNCDRALSNLRPGRSYFLPAGVWRFTRPFRIPSHVRLTGDGTGLVGTDLVYGGPAIPGAFVTAGAPGQDWVDGHLAAVEIETDQLHQMRLVGDTPSAAVKIDQAAIGLEVINPTGSSTVDNVNVWKFGSHSVLSRITRPRPAPGSFSSPTSSWGPARIHSRSKGAARSCSCDSAASTWDRFRVSECWLRPTTTVQRA